MDIEIFGYIAGTLTTVCFVPQAWKIIMHKKADGVSLQMYAIFAAGLCFWLAYGVFKDSNPIILFNSLSLALTSLILFKLLHLRKNG